MDTNLSLLSAIQQVQTEGLSAYRTPTGQVVGLNPGNLRRSYEAILMMAGIEQILTKLIEAKNCKKLQDSVEDDLIKIAATKPYQTKTLGWLIFEAKKSKVISPQTHELLNSAKNLRDEIMHGEMSHFGKRSFKAVNKAFQFLIKESHLSPNQEILNRLTLVRQAAQNKEMMQQVLLCLRDIHVTIEIEKDLREFFQDTEKRVHRKFFECILNLFKGHHAKKHEPSSHHLKRRLHATMLLRNHLIHGLILDLSEEQRSLLNTTYHNICEVLQSRRFRRNGGSLALGSFSNHILL